MANTETCPFAGEKLEAAGGVEPPMEILQTSALPLGYAAVRELRPRNAKRQTTEARPLPSAATSRESGAGEGTRTLDLLHGKQTL